ncbi:TetR/AcrR family transcriptional regulator [Lysobacter enzymogenes]|uniref:TetR family transcription factor n=1 Tax=Lysobacter enzymogenes TaxID=69 RepID=A0A2D3I2U6_LYSEN|nr:TetR/AcrR family transcriptional regulator [Lysobacter enzymogenes]ATU81871.1 TetR family transcription factor [Lysobacter enzymogenes]ROU06558.1 TetR/AcrR family transcriptional regulator [Lysobacter enzymogenes]
MQNNDRCTAPSRAGRSNRERTEGTRRALLDAARALFVARGYSDTSTPDVVAAAGVTRGALYHHFADKRELFRHVLEAEAEAVREAILAAAPADLPARASLLRGAEAYLDSMTVPGRTRLLLIDGPAVLGAEQALAIDAANAGSALQEGLAEALGDADLDVAPLARLLSASFDRAALEIDAGADARQTRNAMLWLLAKALD